MNSTVSIALLLMILALGTDVPSVHTKVQTGDLHRALHHTPRSHSLLLHDVDPHMTIVVRLTGHLCDPMTARLTKETELGFLSTPLM